MRQVLTALGSSGLYERERRDLGVVKLCMRRPTLDWTRARGSRAIRRQELLEPVNHFSRYIPRVPSWRRSFSQKGSGFVVRAQQLNCRVVINCPSNRNILQGPDVFLLRSQGRFVTELQVESTVRQSYAAAKRRNCLGLARLSLQSAKRFFRARL
jgi:hypothetical protein